MVNRPPPGTFRLYPFANPPLTAGAYTLTGEVTGLPGTVEPLQAALDVTAPRFALPPDQVLSTFPPAGARGAFTSRLPQVVIRRRTVPWERAELTADGRVLSSLTPEQRRSTTPRPWLALVLIAEGEGTLLSDVPVAACTTPGASLRDPADVDVVKSSCLEVPASVVEKVFPALEDLPSLVHVREVDLADTELALGDDDGWMAVVLGNRLPQAGIQYTACLVNLEGQYAELPVDPPVSPTYVPLVTAVDLTLLDAAVRQYTLSSDAAVIGTTTFASQPQDVHLPASQPQDGVPRPGAGGVSGTVRASTTAAAFQTGWSSSTAVPVTASAGVEHSVHATATADLTAVGSGLSVQLPWYLIERTVRFPVLLSWSFSCTDAGDFQFLAQNVSSRLLGHVATGPESPDGEPLPPGAVPTGLPAEPRSARPLPLITATGHVETAHDTRRGEHTQAWFRGPCVPGPVDRPGARPDGRYPVAHHADQLRRVTPDGREDLSYAAAFEIGRLLALSRPSVVAALNQWRRQRFAAATTAALGDHLAGIVPQGLGSLFARADTLTDHVWITEGLPGPAAPDDPRSAAGMGRRFVRGLLAALGDVGTELAPVRPLADPGFAVNEAVAFGKGRDGRLARGLALPDGSLEPGAAGLADRLWGAPVASAPHDLEADRAAARSDLEDLAGRLTDATGQLLRRLEQEGPS